MTIIVAVIIGAVVLLLGLALAVRIVKQYEQGVLFRLGRVVGTRNPGLRVIIPFVDNLRRVSLRIVTMPIQSQGIITRDNVSVDVSAVAYFRVVDAVKSVVAIESVGTRHRPDRPDHAPEGCRSAHPRRDAVRDGPDQPRHPRDPRPDHHRLGRRGDPGRAQGHPAARTA